MSEPLKHTPGPWAFNMSFGSWVVRQDPANWDGMGYQGICTVPAERKDTHYGEMFAANARLITAAPELLDALKLAEESLGAFVSDHGWSQRDMDNFDTVSAAIAKATGANK